MSLFPTTLKGAADLFLPGLRAITERAPSQVQESSIRENLLRDSIELVVVHTIATRYEIENRQLGLISKRISDALLIRDGTPKKINSERRKLHWRGHQAKKTKPKRLV